MRSSRFIIIHRHRKAAQKESRPIALLRGIGLTLLGAFLIFLTAAGLYYAFFTQSLPSLTRFEQLYKSRPEPTRFYARDGETLLFTLAYEDFSSEDLRLCETEGEGCFPQTFLQAARITRETAVNQGEKYPLAEEMVRNVYADYIAGSRYPDLTARMLAFQVQQTFGKDQIETWYYNQAWFGQMAFGLDAAAHLYLDKSADELNDAECVLMSAIINAPMLNPIDSKGALRDFYLSRLADLRTAGLFNSEQADELARSNFIIFEPPQYTDAAEPDIITRKALNTAINYYGREKVERGGLKIITSEDISLQSYLRCVTSQDNEGEDSACPLSSLYTGDKIKTAAEALRTAPVSIAVLEVNTGQILAELEAAKDEGNSRLYETALRAYPVGTSMNYFAALTAFSSGSSPSTLLWDLETFYPQETDNEISEPYQGPIQLREALASDHQRALNAHLQRFGSGAVQRNAALLGLSGSGSFSETDLLTLGESCTAEALAYSLIPFAGLGEQTGSTAGGSLQPVSILRVITEEDDSEFFRTEIRKALIADNLAYLVHNVFSRQSGSLSLPDRPSAAKIGTVKGDPGRWISGYTTEISCAMRVGDPQTASAFVADGDKVLDTLEILWQSVMEKAHEGRKVSGWDVPAGISHVKICLPSGKLPTFACRETMTDVFLAGNEPYEFDEYYVELPINRENRMLATRFTDPDKVINEIFLNLPNEASEWAAAVGIEKMPADYDPIRNGSMADPGIIIESPAAFQDFSGSGKIDIVVRLSFSAEAESMQVSIGSGMYPDHWEEVCSGGPLENGQWMLCSLDSSSFEPGLYVLRTAFTLPDQIYRSAETYFQITGDIDSERSTR